MIINQVVKKSFFGMIKTVETKKESESGKEIVESVERYFFGLKYSDVSITRPKGIKDAVGSAFGAIV